MNALGVEEPNEAFEYAYKQLKGLRGHRLTRAIDDLRRDRVFNRLVSQLADPYHATQYPFPAGGLRKV